MKEENRNDPTRGLNAFGRTVAPFAKIGGEFGRTIEPFAKIGGELARAIEPFVKTRGELAESMEPPKPASAALAELQRSPQAISKLAEMAESMGPSNKPISAKLADLAELMGPFAGPHRPFLEAMEPFIVKPAARQKTETLSYSALESEILGLKKRVADLERQAREKDKPPKPPKPPWQRFMDLNLDLAKFLLKGAWRLGQIVTAIGGLGKILELLQREPTEVGQV